MFPELFSLKLKLVFASNNNDSILPSTANNSWSSILSNNIANQTNFSTNIPRKICFDIMHQQQQLKKLPDKKSPKFQPSMIDVHTNTFFHVELNIHRFMQIYEHTIWRDQMPSVLWKNKAITIHNRQIFQIRWPELKILMLSAILEPKCCGMLDDKTAKTTQKYF